MTRQSRGTVDPLARFLLGLAGGAFASGTTYAITTVPPWWWSVGLAVACLIWFGELIVDALD